MTSKVFTDNPSGPGTPVDIPLYRSHKIVAAAPIIEFDIHRLTLDIGDGERGLAVIEPDMFARYTPVPGDYFVQYEDGYCSISPKDAFEAGYSAVSADEVKSKTVLPEKEPIEAELADDLEQQQHEFDMGSEAETELAKDGATQ